MNSSAALLLCALPAALLCACSLKEDRRGCPCVLSVTSDAARSAPGADVVEFDITHGVGECIALSRPVPESDGALETEVCRGEVRVSAYASSLPGSGQEIIIPHGSQAPVLYAASDTLFCGGEQDSVSLRLCKQFACIDITLTGEADSAAARSVALQGRVCGWRKPQLTPIEGDFYKSGVTDSRSKIIFTVPRQKDNSLELLFLDADGGVLSTCRIGEEIRTRGYDWSARSLQDIRMSIQCSEAEFTVTSCEWVDGMIMEVEI